MSAARERPCRDRRRERREEDLRNYNWRNIVSDMASDQAFSRQACKRAESDPTGTSSQSPYLLSKSDGPAR